ncbi:MAG: tRNA (guanosine(37)-N1)-methyltransferase TrmD [Proteobacteria bacterium]|nr:tRNA (guanosine(37)-N1)-methyltransferase TrmD [Pseudomonadota bacterium]NDC23548.1 tRNA (guanosine(37)-N1)-methyltransferase TrmD [Pseudomonadota bacterium]NDD03666.1 tRNA (guanosine(37)-N1)-methyltransferase TrmD [Pseudomonadota bacterium]NDG25841.1 tRNA (guanosine(37)-N1)-methyltransferase TrmD [Pseudomonadota bacterium]
MNKPHFHFVTLFPEVIRTWMETSILGRAVDKALINFSIHQLRDFSIDNYRSVDDSAYGGGGGMVLKVDVLVAAVEHIWKCFSREKCRVIYFSPAGRTLTQDTVEVFATQYAEPNLILICGHYEGVDQRFIDHWVDNEISLGDFVLTGGELPALAFVDTLSRQVEGTLGNEQAHHTESFSLREGSKRLLEYPHFTRPQIFRELAVPAVLLQGDHTKIAQWRKEQALFRTSTRRPDLLSSPDKD